MHSSEYCFWNGHKIQLIGQWHIKWYNVDLENSAKFRLNYIKDSNRVKALAYSAMDSSWVSEIDASDVLFIIEGLSMYLSEEDNKRILDIIDGNFKSCTVFTEIMPPVSVKNVKEKSVEEMDAKFIWGGFKREMSF